jgi:hypothetical protein
MTGHRHHSPPGRDGLVRPAGRPVASTGRYARRSVDPASQDPADRLDRAPLGTLLVDERDRQRLRGSSSSAKRIEAVFKISLSSRGCRFSALSRLIPFDSEVVTPGLRPASPCAARPSGAPTPAPRPTAWRPARSPRSATNSPAGAPTPAAPRAPVAGIELLRHDFHPANSQGRRIKPGALHSKPHTDRCVSHLRPLGGLLERHVGLPKEPRIRDTTAVRDRAHKGMSAQTEVEAVEQTGPARPANVNHHRVSSTISRLVTTHRRRVVDATRRGSRP